MALKIVSLKQLAATMVEEPPKEGAGPNDPGSPSEALALVNLQSTLEDLARTAQRGEPIPEPEPTQASQPAAAPQAIHTTQQLTAPRAAFEVFDRHCEPRMREGFRKLRNRLEEERMAWKEAGSLLSVVTVLSAQRGDGRSITARNLAACLGTVPEIRVLLVDADIIRPSFARRYGIERSPGLAEALESPGQNEWIASLYHVPESGVSVMPAGVSGGLSLDRLNYARLPAFLDQARRHFDWIVFDAPSLESADAEILSRLTDGSLVVLRGEKTYFEEASAALRRIHRTRLLGMVLNQAR